MYSCNNMGCYKHYRHGVAISHWENLNTFFDYPSDIRKAIYTTNAIEPLNSVIRKAIKKRKLFPSDNAAKKVVYLAIMAASKKWTMPDESPRNNQ